MFVPTLSWILTIKLLSTILGYEVEHHDPFHANVYDAVVCCNIMLYSTMCYDDMRYLFHGMECHGLVLYVSVAYEARCHIAMIVI